MKNIFFESSPAIALKVFNYILSNLKPTYIYEYITLFYVKKAIAEINNPPVILNSLVKQASTASAAAAQNTSAKSANTSSKTRSSLITSQKATAKQPSDAPINGKAAAALP